MAQKKNYILFSNILFIIYISSLIGCGAFFYYRIKVLDEAFDKVTESIRIKQKIKQVEAEVSISESAQRGFLLTGDSVFLEDFHTANVNAYKAIDTIIKLTAANHIQQQNALELKELTTIRFRLLKQILESGSFFNEEPNVKKVQLLNGKRIMDSLLSLNDTMVAIENRVLADRRKFRNETRELTPKYVFGILLFSVLIITVCYFAMLRFFRR